MEQLLLPWINLFPPSILHPKRPFPTTSTQLHSNQFTRVNLAAGRTKVHKLRMAEGEKKSDLCNQWWRWKFMGIANLKQEKMINCKFLPIGVALLNWLGTHLELYTKKWLVAPSNALSIFAVISLLLNQCNRMERKYKPSLFYSQL